MPSETRTTIRIIEALQRHIDEAGKLYITATDLQAAQLAYTLLACLVNLAETGMTWAE